MGMSSRRPSATIAFVVRCAPSFRRRSDSDLVEGITVAAMRLRTIPSVTGINSLSVIHNPGNMPYRIGDDVLRMPTRRPTREPFHPCPVAVLKDQEA